jgi:hypothetical protein
VLCPESGPWSSTVLKIKLTRGLPVKYGNAAPLPAPKEPWAIETTTGWECLYFTGARTIIGNQAANYFCPNINSKNWLWGYPSRKTEPWTIFYAPASAGRLTHKANVAVAWF